MNTLLSIGHGYSAQALARLLVPLGWRVLATTRDAAKFETLAATGVTPILYPEAVSDAIDQATHVLSSVAPSEGGDPVLTAFSETIENAGHLQWVGYLSTTGVYGNRDGDWVDETSELRPSTKRGTARVQAEAAWQRIDGLPLHIFRLAGIYGPGRGPFEKVRNGTARRIIKPGQVFSRIHVDDIASVLLASLQQPNPGAVYNVCDDDPAPPQDVLAHAAELLGLPVPPAVDFEKTQMSPMARSFYAESKKVRNDLIKSELGIELQYPDYRAGLVALLRTADA